MPDSLQIDSDNRTDPSKMVENKNSQHPIAVLGSVPILAVSLLSPSPQHNVERQIHIKSAHLD